MADEIQDIRAFGSETELHQVQVEVARRMRQLVNDVELTWEHYRLGAVQGIMADADGSPLVNAYTEFGVAQPAEVALDLANTLAGALRPKIEAITRAIIRAAKGAFTTGSRIVALCGDAFWDEFVNHVDVRTTFLNHEAAAALREPTAFGTFRARPRGPRLDDHRRRGRRPGRAPRLRAARRPLRVDPQRERADVVPAAGEAHGAFARGPPRPGES
jgi:hypothetical protein